MKNKDSLVTIKVGPMIFPVQGALFSCWGAGTDNLRLTGDMRRNIHTKIYELHGSAVPLCHYVAVSLSRK